MKTLTCLEEIIGLSRTECECYDDGKPGNYDVSKSGLFLDELDGLELKMINADIECGENDIWSKMERAVANSKITFRKDFMKCLGETTGAKRNPFYGRIGLTEWTKSLSINNTSVGVRIRTCNIKGAEFTLNGIATLMDTNASFDIKIYNNLQPTPLVTLNNINAVADVTTDNDLTAIPDLTFPLYTEECDTLEYYIIYEPAGAFAPRNIQTSCSCNNRPDWEKWADVQGVKGDDIAKRETWFTSRDAFGLYLDIQFNCNTIDLICGGTNSPMDFDNDDKAMVTAYAIRYEAGRSLIDNILGSMNVNRYTLLNSESLWTLRNHFFERYSELIAYLCQETDIHQNDCLMCDDKRIMKTSILS